MEKKEIVETHDYNLNIRRYVDNTQNVQLLLVVSTHSSFLSAEPVETRVVFQQPARQ